MFVCHTHNTGKEGKIMGVPWDDFVPRVQALLDEVQAGLLADATAFRDENIVDVSSYEELKEAVAAGEVCMRASIVMGGGAWRLGQQRHS